ncbi:hypothetical protein [Flavobacterium sp. W20_MBD1_R3]|uniref:hypothetical protein n=1 Tax=Flavobacterium sp. W20_MBD1_R3 TaxID=3240278 RepID=UPI003F939D03
MKTIAILYIGGHLEITATVVRLLNAVPAWSGVGVMNIEEAKKVFMENKFTIVLLGSGIEEENEIDLRAFFKKQNPQIIIVQHYGGGSGLLKSEILLAIEQA